MKYAEYKKTGALWIESVPAEWRCQKIASLFTQRKTKVSDKDYPALSVAKIGVVPQLETAVKTDAGDNRKLVCAGDFVINSRSDRKGSCGVAEQNGSVSLINIVLTPRQEWNNRYVHYLLRSQPFAEEYYHYGRGIVADLWTTRYSEMKNIMLPVPPREEQDQIVCYLDWQVSKINKLIAARKKQITLLKELRKAITDEGILRGFTSSEMKDSGVLWLGSVPEHWSVKPLKRVCRVNASIAHLTTALNDDTRVTFLPMENVSVIGEVDCTIKKPLSEVRSGFSSFAKGDVVVAKITPCFENGKGACLDSLDTEIGFGTTEFINLRPSHDINPKYLYLITMTRPFRVLGEKVMTGSAGQKRVSPEYIKNFTIGIPPLDEQNNILEEIDRRVSRIDEQIRCENESISVLFELRTRLISDVVTGKIDVRGIEVPDFDIVEEIDSDDENLDDEDAAEETEEQEE